MKSCTGSGLTRFLAGLLAASLAFVPAVADEVAIATCILSDQVGLDRGATVDLAQKNAITNCEYFIRDNPSLREVGCCAILVDTQKIREKCLATSIARLPTKRRATYDASIGAGATKEDAQRMALRNCQSQYSQCSEPSSICIRR